MDRLEEIRERLRAEQTDTGDLAVDVLASETFERHAASDMEYLLGIIDDMRKFEERLIESMDQLRYETIILADKVESARGWAKLWKREAKMRRHAVINLSRMWRDEATKNRG